MILVSSSFLVVVASGLGRTCVKLDAMYVEGCDFLFPSLAGKELHQCGYEVLLCKT